MASSPIQINMALNTSDVAKGARDAEDSLNDLEQAVGDLGDSSRDADRLERSMDDVSDATRDAADEIGDFDNVLSSSFDRGKREAGDLERAMRDVQDETRDTARAADKIGDDGARGFRRFGDAGEEVSGELRQNLGETFSSFRGDLEDLPQLAQDTLGGLAGSGALGGIPGLFLTAAGAAGLGALLGGMETLQEEAEAARERVQAIAETYLETGSTILSESQIIAKGTEIATDPELYKEAKQAQEDWGVSWSTTVAAMAGDTDALALVFASLEDQTATLDDKIGTNTDSITGMSEEFKTAAGSVNAGREAYEKYSTAAETAAEQTANQSRLLIELINASDEAGVQVDKLGNKVYTLPDGQQILISAETGQATTDLDTFKGELDETGRKVVNPKVRVEVDSSAWDLWTPRNKIAWVEGRPVGNKTLDVPFE